MFQRIHGFGWLIVALAVTLVIPARSEPIDAGTVLEWTRQGMNVEEMLQRLVDSGEKYAMTPADARHLIRGNVHRAVLAAMLGRPLPPTIAAQLARNPDMTPKAWELLFRLIEVETEVTGEIAEFMRQSGVPASVLERYSAPPATPATPATPTQPPVQPEVVEQPPAPPPSQLAAELAATPGVGTVERTIHDQRPDLFTATVRVEGLSGAIEPNSKLDSYFARFLPGANAIRSREVTTFQYRVEDWNDDGPYARIAGFATAGQPVKISVECPEKPALQDGETTIARRLISFVVHETVLAPGEEELELNKDEDAGTLTWTPVRSEELDRTIGPAVIGVYVEYIAKTSVGRLAGGPRRIGWIFVANPGAPLVVDGALATIAKPGGVAQLDRSTWAAGLGAPRPAELGRLATVTEMEGRQGLFRISEDLRRLIRVIPLAEGAACVEIEGLRSPAYEDINHLTLSRDGSRFYFVGRFGNWNTVVVNGKEERPFDDVSDFRTSEDGLRYAYVGRDGDLPAGEFTVMLDGKPVSTYTGGRVKQLTFSPDGSRFAYARADDAGESMAIDGVQGPVFENIPWDAVRFSANGKRSAYVAQQGDETIGFIDGTRIEGALARDEIVFSADGERVAYTVKTEGGVAVVVDGQVGNTYDDLWHDPVFSPDGKRVAYAAITEGRARSVAVIDGAEQEVGITFHGIGRPVFSADSARVAYAVTVADNEVAVVVDGQKIADGRIARELTFSPDGKRVAWFDRTDKGTVAVVDGVGGIASRDMYTDEPVMFSPDSKHFFNFAKTEAGIGLFMDHNLLHEADLIAPKLFFDVPGKVRFVAHNEGALTLLELPLP